MPNHFLENVLCYSLTNCKTYANFIASRSPGGAYPYLSNWLNNQAREPIKFPDGMVKAVFDNNQKVGKTYLITRTNVVPTSVMTSHLWITFDANSNLQTEKSLKPDSWMWKNRNTAFREELTKFLTRPSPQFRKSRNAFVETCIRIVHQQHDGSLTDYVDEMVKHKNTVNTEKTC